jgi:hypothetical protein
MSLSRVRAKVVVSAARSERVPTIVLAFFEIQLKLSRKELNERTISVPKNKHGKLEVQEGKRGRSASVLRGTFTTTTHRCLNNPLVRLSQVQASIMVAAHH